MIKESKKKNRKDKNEPATKGDIYNLEDRLERKFEKFDQKFEKIDQRFEKIDERFEKIDQKMLENMRYFSAEIDRRNTIQTEEILRYMDIRFAEIQDNHAQIMSFLYEHFPIQQKQVMQNTERIERIEQHLNLEAPAR